MRYSKWFVTGLLSCLIALLAVVPAADAQQLKELNFGVIPAEVSQASKDDWRPLAEDMSKALGIKVNMFFATDYAGIIEGMRFNKVQMAWFGNKAAMEAVDRAGGEVFAHVVNLDGTAGYWSLLIVHKDSDIKSLDDILKNGKKYSFGNGDPNSTSGFLVPAYYVFAANKIDPKTHFRIARNATHETNALAVLSRQLDVATYSTLHWDRLQKLHPDKAAQLRIIWKSPLVPNDPLVWRKDLPAELKAKIRDFILSYGRTGPDAERQRQVLAHLVNGWLPFRESSDAQLIPIRQLSLAKDRMNVESSQSLSPKEKQAQLALIDTKLAELEKQVPKGK